MMANTNFDSDSRAQMHWTAAQLTVLRGLDIPVWVGAELPETETVASLTAIAQGYLPEVLTELANELPTRSIPELGQVKATTPLDSNERQVSIAAIHQANWSNLASLAANCQRCELSTGRRLPLEANAAKAQLKGGVLVVLDPAYATDEYLLGEQAATLLNAILTSTGHDLASAYITTTVKCGQTEQWRSLNPMGKPITACAPFLARQIQLKQAPLILAMGQGAAQALLGLDEPLESLRGELHGFECEGYSGQLIATHHPEALLSAPQLKREVWQDLCLAIAAGLTPGMVKSTKR